MYETPLMNLIGLLLLVITLVASVCIATLLIAKTFGMFAAGVFLAVCVGVIVRKLLR